jgi:TPR repeat protein
MYMKEGYWIVQNDESAIEMWLKSAEMGYAPCQFNMGAAYLSGTVIEKDLLKAKYWLGKAIDSTYTKYSKVSKQLYALYELDKY